ncbi:BZ3500_MvSof-1268-A1-R1_Chr6-1g08389 [Microbotryum saponariae]|uniref:BZ3500_MvSof-1268-A1-R1_Chr6-1g08389 protein n=1 Tax=Microbotryum saponariae TaxID=289078 RepID=A0A2X0KK32_9BASI|nr:BZ3500_MvSof-1268-A1-R1_Chr6-1g08389 [Microbotryum saponariae]SDA07673.1 BZ3501_MvSof-1269-A2-R1_Chr6-1g08110 [Microbotryum saponariae]
MPPLPLSHLLTHSIATSPAVVRRTTRLFSSSFALRDDASATTEQEQKQEQEQSTTTSTPTPVEEDSSPSSSSGVGGGGGGGRGFRAWLRGDGAQYRRGIKGATNWIGETPFPLNPTFKPLPPVSELIKTKVYHAYLGNLQTNSPNTTTPSDLVVVRAISSKFGLSMARVRAIIRLKELEQEWKKRGLPLQTNLRQGMESFLGVKTPTEQSGSNWRGIERAEQGQRVEQIRTEGKAGWEMVDSENGERSVFLPLLQHLSTTSTTTVQGEDVAAEQAPKKPVAQIKIVQPTRPGRPRFSFENVEGTERGNTFARTYNPKKTKRGNRKRLVGSDDV